LTWQENIINRLNLREKSNKIILDKIGILICNSFTDFLDKVGLKYAIVENVSQILNTLQLKNIILSSYFPLPAYLNKKAEIIEFNYNFLPIDVDPNVLPKLSTKQLENLLDYQLTSKDLRLIQTSNYQQILVKAGEYRRKKDIDNIKIQILEKLYHILDYHDILTLGKLYGQYTYLCFQQDLIPDPALIQKTDEIIEPLILEGLIQNAFYASASDFQTVDKILHYIKYQNYSKIALVCFDGMGMSEWQLLKEFLNDDFEFIEKHIFALIPTMTGISRSAIFYGDSEKVYSLNSINEDKAFADFFSNLSVSSYREGEINNQDILLGIDAVKIVFNVFDDFAHKTVLPPAAKRKNIYFRNAYNYLNKSSIKNELLLLKDLGYRIWFCSDHGSVLAKGNGQTIDNYLIESSCKRATIISKTDLAEFYDVNIFKIPFVKDKVVLLAKKRTVFTHKNKTEISHGGITLDELVVPFVEVIN